jgi:hypothetical protein
VWPVAMHIVQLALLLLSVAGVVLCGLAVSVSVAGVVLCCAGSSRRSIGLALGPAVCVNSL